MIKLLRRVLGITVLEERITELEKSQTSVDSQTGGELSDNVLDEWINGEEVRQ